MLDLEASSVLYELEAKRQTVVEQKQVVQFFTPKNLPICNSCMKLYFLQLILLEEKQLNTKDKVSRQLLIHTHITCF